MGKKNKTRREKHRKRHDVVLLEDSPYYEEYLNDPIALVQDGAYELLIEWEARQNGFANAGEMIDTEEKLDAAKEDEYYRSLECWEFDFDDREPEPGPDADPDAGLTSTLDADLDAEDGTPF